MPTETTACEGLLEQAQEKTYVHIPFEVPLEATWLEVRLTYSDRIGAEPWRSGGNTIDLGVFDSRGLEFLGSGFRGWSGSERETFFITETEATPGYLAGPLLPGQWHVLLGLYKIAAAGCTYRITMTIAKEPGHQVTVQLPQPVPWLPASQPPAPFRPWLRGELHCHTWHSDGDSSPPAVVALARSRGLDFLAVSDHNTISSHRELAAIAEPGLILIRAVECTTYRGHFNVWGSGQFVDFRVSTPEQMEAAIQYAADKGGLTSCNHPFPSGPGWEYPQVTNYHSMEVWNGPWHPGNAAALDLWVSRLATGARIPAVGGSDWHSQPELARRPARAPGTPTVWVYVPDTPSAEAIVRAVNRGHVALSNGPDGPFLDLRAGTDDAAMGGDLVSPPDHGLLPVRVICRRGVGSLLRLLDQTGVLMQRTIGANEESIETELTVAESLYVRAELRGAGDEMQALTNPIYLDVFNGLTSGCSARN